MNKNMTLSEIFNDIACVSHHLQPVPDGIMGVKDAFSSQRYQL